MGDLLRVSVPLRPIRVLRGAMIKLSPSDFAFLWEQCKRCFYLKVVHGIRQPSMPFSHWNFQLPW